MMLQALVSEASSESCAPKGLSVQVKKGEFSFGGSVKEETSSLQASLELSPSQVARETSECFFPLYFVCHMIIF